MLAAFPNLVLKSLRTAVKMVRTIVYRKSILNSVKGELAQSDAICIASRHLSRAWAVAEIACSLGVSEHDVSQRAVLVRHNNLHDACTYRRYFYICSLGVGKGVEEYLLS